MNLLIIDDDQTTLELLKEVFEKENFWVYTATSPHEALRKIEESNFPVILSDIKMPEGSGLDFLKTVKGIAPESVVVLMTGFGEVKGTIEAIRLGAFDYISKPFKLTQLRTILQRAKDHYRSQRRSTTALQAAPETEPFIGKSSTMIEVYKLIARASLCESSVLLTGENGTGKERAAKIIHENSSRSGLEFKLINCGTLRDEGLMFALDSQATSGTLFLDDIADLEIPSQIQLLEYFRRHLGSDLQVLPFRIIAATSEPLDLRVKSGSFRDDLYYQLKVIDIQLPPLRERKEDFVDLVQHFIQKYSLLCQKSVSHASSEALELLKLYPWPGNIRELEHLIERAVVLAKSKVIYPEDFPDQIQKANSEMLFEKSDSLNMLEKEHILKVLVDNKFNKSKTAEVLGIDRKTLHRKCVRYGLLTPKKSKQTTTESLSKI